MRKGGSKDNKEKREGRETMGWSLEMVNEEKRYGTSEEHRI